MGFGDIRGNSNLYHGWVPIMNMSVQMERVCEYAIEKDLTLNALSFTPSKGVAVSDEDGSSFTFRSAFVEKARCDDDIYIIVYTEHHGLHVFPESELNGWCEFTISVPTTLNVTLTTEEENDEAEPAGTVEETRWSPWRWLWGGEGTKKAS
jgi:hypothetical protein